MVSYKTLMQVTIINDCYVFSLDNPARPAQISHIESIDLLMNPEKMINIGYRPQYAEIDEEMNDQIRIKEIIYNQNADYFFTMTHTYEQQG